MDGAILRAATDLLTSTGVQGTTIHAVARRSGVARASIYLRYANRDALITAAIRAAIGRDPVATTGDLERDFQRGADQVRAVLSSTPFQIVLPRLVEGLLQPGTSQRAMTFDMLAPNRSLLVDEYRALAATSGFRDDVDADLVVDLLIGGLLTRLLVTGSPPTPTDARQAVSILLDGLRLGKGSAPS